MDKQAKPQGKSQDDLNQYSFAGAYLPPRAALRMLGLQSKIKAEDLGDDGRELQPHTTVKYGIKSDDVAELRKVLAGVKPIKAKLSRVSLFTNPKHDVLKYDVDSDDLHKVHRLISEHFENEDTWPEYKPHVTLAYLKPGAGKKYLHLNQLAGDEVVFKQISFRDRNGKKHTVRLGEEPEMDKVAFLQGYKEAGDIKLRVPTNQERREFALLRRRKSTGRFLFGPKKYSEIQARVQKALDEIRKQHGGGAVIPDKRVVRK